MKDSLVSVWFVHSQASLWITSWTKTWWMNNSSHFFVMFVVNLHVWMSHLLGPTIGLAATQKGRGNLPFAPYVCAVPLSPCFRLAPCSRNSYLSAWERHSQEDAFQRRIGGSPDSDSFTVAQRKCSTRRMLEQETILFCFVWDLKQGKSGVGEKRLSNLDWGFSVTRDCDPQQMEKVKL